MPKKKKPKLFEEINKELGVIKKRGENQKVVNLTKVPQKEKVQPQFNDFEKGFTHQMDILFLPNDDGYRYALVVIDNASRIGDTRAMKVKSAKETLKAVKEIYRGKYLKWPERIETDSGGEFEGIFNKELKKRGISHKVGRPHRSRQEALVEYLNGVIGKSVMTRQTAEELKTGETSRQWVEDLPKIMRVYNNYIKKSTKKHQKSVWRMLDLLNVKDRSAKCLKREIKSG